MSAIARLLPLGGLLLSLASTAAASTSAEVIAHAHDSDWRRPDPANTMVMRLDDADPVVIEFAPGFAPEHVANIIRLTRAGYFNGTPITRVQDNYVTQWGSAERAADFSDAARRLPDEYFRASAASPPLIPLPDGDVYAPVTGFADGFPAARGDGQSWLAHCYGMVGVGRDNPPDNGSGSELYVVIGNEPRHLDRNIALVGRVIAGMHRLSSLPRGPAPAGVYEDESRHVPIVSVTMAADLPEDQRPDVQLLRAGTATWTAWVESRRNRQESWFTGPAGHISLCNVPIPTRIDGGEAIW